MQKWRPELFLDHLSGVQTEDAGNLLLERFGSEKKTLLLENRILSAQKAEDLEIDPCFYIVMGGGASSQLKDASPEQVQETFKTLSSEEQKKVADALALIGQNSGDAPTPGLSEEQRTMLKAAYADIDTNKSGTIEVSEFKSATCSASSHGWCDQQQR